MNLKPGFAASCGKLLGFLPVIGVLTFLCACSTKYVCPPPTSASYTGPRSSGTEIAAKPLEDLIAPRNVVHEVGPLETVWRLSKMYDVTMEEIYRANGLKSGDVIHIGQKLTIPNARTLRHVIALYPSTRWKYVVVHHTATDIGNATLIHRSHNDRGFWHGLGYHFLIGNGTLGKGDGQIEVSPRWIKQQDGAHCKAGSMNNIGIGVALVGNFNEDLPTENQLQSLSYLLKILCEHYRIPYTKIIGHRDVDGAKTDCPGKRFPWSGLRQCLSTF